MSLYDVPHDVLEKITRYCCLSEQRNLSILCKVFHESLRLKLELYKNEVNHILNYIRMLHNRSLTEQNLVVMHIVFREQSSRIKITLNSLIKLNFSYRLDNSFLSEKIQTNYYFSNISELIEFVYLRLLACNTYSNVLLFSQKYHYYKVY